MSVKIELSIFNPLGEYFKVMSTACDGIAKGCSDDKFKSIITNDCDVSGNATKKGEVSERFIVALELFALNLKTFDSPISSFTIKGKLYAIFKEAFKLADYEPSSTILFKLTDASQKKILTQLVNNINISKLLKMNDSIVGVSGETYAENLEKQLNLVMTLTLLQYLIIFLIQ